MINYEQIAKIYAVANPFWATKRSLDFENFKKMFNSYQSLPENIKLVATDQISADIIWQISQKNKLSEEQISNLAIIVWKILSAEIPIPQFISDISRELNLPVETARAVAQEINVRIFSKATLQIKRLQEKNFGEMSHKDTRLHSYGVTDEQARKQDTNKSQISNLKSQIHRPEERVVDLHKEKSLGYIETGPKVEGNVVDLSN